ncbi:MAG: hypothetical protein AABY75_00215 [Bacteroidota bacterium]
MSNNKRITMRNFTTRLALLALTAGLAAGCSKDSTGPSTSSSVSLIASFSKAAGVPGLLKASGTLALDSLRIDSAVVVLQRIKFEGRIDSVQIDTTGMMSDDARELEVTFRGPFVIHVRDTIAIDFASQTLPAGTYDGVKFKIHRLQRGEFHHDSDERSGGRHMIVDSLPYGSSVMVWGAVKKNGVWANFAFAYDGELEFKVRGNFTVSTATSNIAIALNFNMGLWFKHPSTGALLDPTDLSSNIRGLIKEAIKKSFEQGRGGRDRDHDGHPED